VRQVCRLLAALTFCVVISGLASAQTAKKVLRLGLLQTRVDIHTVMLAELARQGFVEGRNLIVEMRTGRTEQLPQFARELVDLKPDVIVAGGAAIAAAAKATNTIPIVMSYSGEDPIAAGFAASVARPGGNVTGLVIWSPELDAKRLQLLHEVAPTARRIAALIASPASRTDPLAVMRPVASANGIELLAFYVEFPTDFDAPFAAMRSAGAQALAITADSRLSNSASRLAALALEARLPTVCQWAEMAREGCLIGYGPISAEMHRHAADYVVHIFRGSSPGELPIEGPTRFKFAVNLKTAAMLELTVPQIVLLRADEVIE
jgi:putative ABC transport system substrate-binding protein